MADVLIPAGWVYQYPAVIDRWYDGDTCYVHRGTRPGEVVHGEHVRVQGINAPELHEAGGTEALAAAVALAPPGTLVTLICARPDKYGRLLAQIVLPTGESFGDRMVAEGHAVPYLT